MLSLWPAECSTSPPPWPWEVIDLESTELLHAVQWLPADDKVSCQVSARDLLRRNGFQEYEDSLDLAKTLCPTEVNLLQFVLENIQNISGSQNLLRLHVFSINCRFCREQQLNSARRLQGHKFQAVLLQ